MYSAEPIRARNFGDDTREEVDAAALRGLPGGEETP